MEDRIETPQLVLRILKPTESALVAAFYARNFDDFALYEPLNRKQAISLHYQHTVLEYEDRYRAEGSRIRYYMFQKYDPFRAIGTVSFRDINKEHKGSCVVGYKVDQQFRRRGFAHETLATLIPMVEKYYGLKSVKAEVLPENHASRNLLVGLGFKRDALLRSRVNLKGLWKDEYVYILE